MSERLRWSKFWWQDHENDKALRSCSLAAQGLWMRMLCVMAEAERHGFLLINGRQPSARQLAAITSAPERDVAKYLNELDEAGVFSREPDGTIFCRRMVRDNAAREKAREDGRKGGNPRLKAEVQSEDNRGVNPPLKLQEAEAEAEIQKPPSPPSEVRSPRGCRLPPDWQPNDEDAEYAARLGLDPNRVAENFRDYWHAKAGKDAAKLDWPATWRGWCRRDAERQPRPARSAPQPESKLGWMFPDLGRQFDLDSRAEEVMQ
ncbi:hypothetical protein [Rhodovarius lipocyclicus]|uniref:hypothetical protein n=1 Tax=Rhodovarius lipocyclicus TaxID=268410 RepID=UPI001356F09B|nr:hypothetical protein [Rhodovarius lipocyclicus]